MKSPRARGLRTKVAKPNYLVSEPVQPKKKRAKKAKAAAPVPAKQPSSSRQRGAVYEVEEVLDVRQKEGKGKNVRRHQFLIKWKGYKEPTWEPMSNLTAAAVKKEAGALLEKKGLAAPAAASSRKKKTSAAATAGGAEKDDDATYEVEKILEARTKGKRTQFLVKWKGYEETTWEPMSNLRSAALKKEAKALLEQEKGE